MGCGSNSTQIGQGPAGNNASNCSNFLKFTKIATDAFHLDTISGIITSVTGDTMTITITEIGKYVGFFNCYVKTNNQAPVSTAEVQFAFNGAGILSSLRTETIQAGTATATFKCISSFTEEISAIPGNVITVKARCSGTPGDVLMYSRVFHFMKTV